MIYNLYRKKTGEVKQLYSTIKRSSIRDTPCLFFEKLKSSICKTFSKNASRLTYSFISEITKQRWMAKYFVNDITQIKAKSAYETRWE
jgi:hypothetical protein